MANRGVEVTLAPEAECELIAGLFQFYVYDFSELEPAESDNLDFDARGLFGPPERLPEYWREPGRQAHLIRVGGKPAGFALVDAASHLGAPIDRNMAEFFVARKYRRRGVGAEAVRQVLQGNPGRWEVAVLWRNLGALAFWPGAIAEAGAVDLTAHDGDQVRDWDGLVWSFRIPGR